MLKENPQKRPNIYEVIREVCLMQGKEVPIRDVRQPHSDMEPFRKLTRRRSILVAQRRKPVDTKNCLPLPRRPRKSGLFSLPPSKKPRSSPKSPPCAEGAQRGQTLLSITRPNPVRRHTAVRRTHLPLWMESLVAQLKSLQTDFRPWTSSKSCTKREVNLTLSQPSRRIQKTRIYPRGSPMLWQMMPLPSARLLKTSRCASRQSIGDPKFPHRRM